MEDKLRNQLLQALFLSEEWKALKAELQQMHHNSDNVVHAINTVADRRLVYIGKCDAIKEIMGLEEMDWKVKEEK